MKAFKRMDAEVVKPKVRPAPRDDRKPNDQQPEPEQPRYSTRPIKTTEERTKHHQHCPHMITLQDNKTGLADQLELLRNQPEHTRQINLKVNQMFKHLTG